MLSNGNFHKNYVMHYICIIIYIRICINLDLGIHLSVCFTLLYTAFHIKWVASFALSGKHLSWVNAVFCVWGLGVSRSGSWRSWIKSSLRWRLVWRCGKSERKRSRHWHDQCPLNTQTTAKVSQRISCCIFWMHLLGIDLFIYYFL